MPDMRVLAVGSVYPPHQLGGYEVIWSGVTRYLREQGHEARVLTSDYRAPGVPSDAPEEADVHRELDWYWREHRWRSLGPLATFRLERHNAAVLDRHLAEFKPDVVTWWPVGGMSLSLIERVRRARLPALLFVLDPWPWYGPRRDLWTSMWSRLRPLAPFAEWLTGLSARLELDTAGRWVFCSATMRDQTLAGGLQPAEMTIISPGVERALLSVPREREAPVWGWRLLYAGRVVEQKGVLSAVRSMPLLPAEATLAIVGDGDQAYRASLISEAERLGVSERVTFSPARTRAELPELYRAADVVLFPVEWPEPWGLVPLEAMALGRPVVATGRGGSGEYLVDGSNSLLFAAGDAAALADRVSALAADPELRARLLTGGYETAERHSEGEFNRRALAEIEVVGAPASADSE
jgi:glycosyltransferase involved in cell wall biosynthesis